MSDCLYLLALNSTYCRLKGVENPKCKNCPMKSPRQARSPWQAWLYAPGWTRTI